MSTSEMIVKLQQSAYDKGREAIMGVLRRNASRVRHINGETAFLELAQTIEDSIKAGWPE